MQLCHLTFFMNSSSNKAGFPGLAACLSGSVETNLSLAFLLDGEHPSFHPPTHPPTHPLIHPSMCVSISLTMYQFIHLSIYSFASSSIPPSAHLCTHPFIQQIFLEPLPCTRVCASFWACGGGEDPVPAHKSSKARPADL